MQMQRFDASRVHSEAQKIYKRGAQLLLNKVYRQREPAQFHEVVDLSNANL